MSKRTSGGSRCYGSKWGRTPEARDRRATARRTARRATSAICAVILAASCSRLGPQAEYDRAWKAYLRGELASAASLASAAAARHADRAKPWFWSFRLLQAEALSGQ